MSPTCAELITTLHSLGNEAKRRGKADYGVPYDTALGVSVPAIRQLAKTIKRDHSLALELWGSGYHDARLLAALIADPAQMDEALLNRWVGDVVSWDLCDHLCGNLLYKVPLAIARIPLWAVDDREFVRRVGLVLILYVGMHRPTQFHADVEMYFTLLRQAATDPRLYVKKAVSWSLRDIGKRFPEWKLRAVSLATELAQSTDKTARWIGKDVLKELTV